jgi:hypothetical protein
LLLYDFEVTVRFLPIRLIIEHYKAKKPLAKETKSLAQEMFFSYFSFIF